MNKAMNQWMQQTAHKEYVSWFLYLPRGIDRLKELGTLKKIPAGTVIAEAGCKTDRCYLIKTGRVIGYEYTKGGEQRIYCANEKESLVLEDCLLLGCEVPINFQTTMETELYCISRKELQTIIYENPEAAMDIIQSLSMKLMSVVEQVRFEQEHSATEKVCNLLLAYAGRYGVADSDGTMIREKLSQEYIANLLGLNRVTVVRVMKDLKQQGLLEKKNGYYYLYHIEQMYDYKDEKWA